MKIIFLVNIVLFFQTVQQKQLKVGIFKPWTHAEEKLFPKLIFTKTNQP